MKIGEGYEDWAESILWRGRRHALAPVLCLACTLHPNHLRPNKGGLQLGSGFGREGWRSVNPSLVLIMTDTQTLTSSAPLGLSGGLAGGLAGGLRGAVPANGLA